MHSRWFKSVICMRYTSAEKIAQSNWEGKLKKLQHRAIKPVQRESIGFSPVFGYLSPNMLSHELQNYLFISLTIEEKKLQKNKLKRLVAIKTREFAKNEGKKEEELTKEERNAIKDGVETEMLKDIVPDEYYINAFLDTKQSLLFVDVSSGPKVKRLIEWIQRLDESFDAKPFFDASLEIYLTQWLYKPDENMPQGIRMDQEATLKHDDKSKAVFSNQDLESEEITTLINHDKRVIELALVRDGKLNFKLKADGSLRKLKPTDMLLGEVDRPENMTSILQDMEADWIVMSNELTRLYGWFEKIFEVNATDNTESKLSMESERGFSQADTPPTSSSQELEQASVAELDTLKFG
jgi:recombination associated protein RdgC